MGVSTRSAWAPCPGESSAGVLRHDLESPIRFHVLLGILGSLTAWALPPAAWASLDDPTKPAGQIIVDPESPVWLKRNGQGSYFMVGAGDPEDFLYRGTKNPDGTRNGDQMAFIAQLAASGVNAIYFEIVRSHGDGGSDHDPWIVHEDPSSGLNDAILDQWDVWFDALEAANITLYFFFYDDSCCVPFGGRTRTVGPDEIAFFQAIVDRFEHHPNLIWLVVEEYQEGNSIPVVEALADAIRVADDFDHVIGVHQLNSNDFRFPEDPSLDHFAMQSNSIGTPDEIHDFVVGGWNFALGRYNMAMAEAKFHYDRNAPDRTYTRQFSWAAAMGGAYVAVLGFEPGMPDEILADHGRMADFFETVELTELEPRDELARAETDYVLAADSGRRFVLYARNLTAGERVGLAEVEPGLYHLRWLDVVDGTSVEQQNVGLGGTPQLLPPAGIGGELALSVSPLPPVVPLMSFDGRLLSIGLVSLAVLLVGARTWARARVA